MLTEQVMIELDGLGFSTEEIDRMVEGYGAPLIEEAWFQFEMREMVEEIARPQTYFLGICSRLRQEGFVGTPKAKPSGGHVGRAPVSEAERNRRAWQSKLIETVGDKMFKAKQPADYRRKVLASLTVKAVDHSAIVIAAPVDKHDALFQTFGPLCLGRPLHLIDETTGDGETYDTESIRIAPAFSRDEIRRRAGRA